MKSRYGITPNQGQEIFDWQGNSCGACGTREEFDRQKPWQVDHNHETKTLRLILCSRCNRILAHSGDNAEGVAATMTRLLAYMHACGEGLSAGQVEQVIAALRSSIGLVGDGAADPNRRPREKHEKPA